MSAIYGVLRLDGRPVERETLDRMSETLAHRGPDGAGRWREGSVGLGHGAFHTTPESRLERQPVTAGHDVVLTADARIDNREELIRELGFHGRPSEDVTDADLVVAAHRRWGERCAERLLGDFAFAVWDGASRSLLCVRDHFGVKPLYYFHAPGRLFAFASEIKALLALSEVSGEIDELEVARHLMVPVRDDLASTYYREVRRAPPGHTLTVSPDRVRLRRYWSLDPNRELRLSRDEEYHAAVRETFVEAVRCRLRATTPVASMLSGGLDTSSIVCVAVRLLEEAGGDRLHTLSGIYPDVVQCDESRFIRAVLDRNDVEPHFFEADRVSPVAEIERMHWHGDGANKGGNLYLNWHLYRTASAEGMRVVLDGYDGDSTISHGVAYHRELALAGRWLRLAREARALGRVTGRDWKPPMWRWIRAYGLRPALRRLGLESLGRTTRVRIRGGGNGDGRASVRWMRGLEGGFAESVAQFVEPAPFHRTEREYHHFLLMRSILLHTLGWVEAIGAGTGVEVRFPYFDVRLAELCLSLPPEQKLRRGWTRMAMRGAMEGILPEEIRWRPDKSDISPGFRHGLLSRDLDRIGGAISDGGERARHYLDPDYYKGVHRRFASGHATDDEELLLWRAFSLALWLNAAAMGHSPSTEDRQAAEAVGPR